MHKLDTKQKLKNAIYEIKFAMQPGVHHNGEPRKHYTVEQALDQITKRLGMPTVKIRPLYEVEWDVYKLYSKVTNRSYHIWDSRYGGYMVKWNSIELGPFDDMDALIDQVAELERSEPPID